MISEELRDSLLGEWISLATETRPGSTRNPDGTPQPLFLTRSFRYSSDDSFSLDITTYADPFGKIALAKITLAGTMHWRGEHPVATGAQKVDFIADRAYTVTPLAQGFADVLNHVSAQGYERWHVDEAQSILGKNFVPFNLVADKFFMEYDLIFVANGLLFWGARHVDGRGFDTEQNRPTNLQIPLRRP